MKRGEEQPGTNQSTEAQAVAQAGQGAVDHAHPGQTEQEARIAGVHGWGYGGEPQEKIPVAPTDPTESTDDENMGEIAPPDPDGHHPDWRR